MSSKESTNTIKRRRWRFSRKKDRGKEIQNENVPEIYDLKDLLESKEINLKPRVVVSKSSKLSPSLLDILKKSVALGHFLEFLKEHDKKNLLDFWLEAETFRMISETKYNRRKSITSSGSKSSPNISLRKSSFRQENSILSHVRVNNEEALDSTLNSSFNSNDENWNCNCSDFETSFDSVIHKPVISISSKEETSSSSDLNKVNNLNLIHPTNHEWDNTDAGNTSSTMNILSDNAFSSKKASTLPKTLKSATSIDHFRQRARTRSSIIDAAQIYTKYISLNADYPVYLPPSTRQCIEGLICKDKNAIDPECFTIAQDYVFEKLISLHDEFLLTSNMVSYQLNFLEEKNIKLQDVLYNESCFFYFMEYLDQHGYNPSLEFYLAAENFECDTEQKLLDKTYDVETALDDAMNIYEKYFSMKCEKQLITDDKLRIVLENNICREDGPQPNCFCIPMAYAWTALSEVYLPAFLKSEVFEYYLKYLKKIMQHPDDLKSCSSRSSVSLDDNVPFLKTSNSKLNLFDDKGIDDFWFKPQHHQSTNRLALGHVNEFGVFNSGMEPEPSEGAETDSSVSKLGKAMKNLLRGETSEETEQLAWERARKIIADIQKQTQN